MSSSTPLRIEDAGPDRKARRLVFGDKDVTRLTSAAAVRSIGLEDGGSVDREAVENALAEHEPSLAKEAALRLLGYRDRATVELKRRLADSGYPQPVVDALLERLTEWGLVDDERFARAWVRTRARAGLGARRISHELAQKGVARDLAALVLAEELPRESELDAAVMSLRGATASDRKQRDRLVRRLVARGHALSVAIAAVDSVPSAGEGEVE